MTGAATLSWTAPTTNADGSPITDLAGYHIYYGSKESSMTKTVSVAGSTATTFEITGLSAGTYYFSVVAYNSMGVDSADSNVGTKTIS